MQLAAVGIHVSGMVLTVFAVAELVAFLAFGDALQGHLAFGRAAFKLCDFIFKVEEALIAFCREGTGLQRGTDSAAGIFAVRTISKSALVRELREVIELSTQRGDIRPHLNFSHAGVIYQHTAAGQHRQPAGYLLMHYSGRHPLRCAAPRRRVPCRAHRTGYHSPPLLPLRHGRLRLGVYHLCSEKAILIPSTETDKNTRIVFA